MPVFILALALLVLLGHAALWIGFVNRVHATGAPLLNDPARHLPALLRHTATLLLWAVVPLLAVAALGGLAGSSLQVGGLAAWQRLKPDVNRLNPARGLERLLSLRSLVELAKMVVKTLLLAVLMFFVVRGFVGTALKLGYATPSTTMAVGARVIMMCFAWAAVIYAAMAAVDYVHQRFEFMKQLRMSIEDLRSPDGWSWAYDCHYGHVRKHLAMLGRWCVGAERAEPA